MAANKSLASLPGDRAWFIAQRWQQYQAEGRANLLRIIAIGLFYAVHLLSYFSAHDRLPWLGALQLAQPGEIDRPFHIAATMLALAWSMLALGTLIALQQRIFPWWLPYLTTGCDVLLLSSIICLGAGPQSALVAGYFLVLALAALRFSIPLVRFATVCAVLGYICVLGSARWPAAFGKLALDVRVPRYHQLIVLLAIILAGIILGQLVRRARLLADDVNRRTESKP